MNANQRIKLEMSMLDAVACVCEGNPGAIRVCLEILKHGGQIDPDSLLGGFGVILLLDTLGIYGSQIWILHKDICEENIIATIGMLRAFQLGHISDCELMNAIKSEGIILIDVPTYLMRVRKELPKFIKADQI
jgi:hypothetical protein